MPRLASVLRSTLPPCWNCTIAYEDALAGAAFDAEKSSDCEAGSKMPARRIRRLAFGRAASIASGVGDVAAMRVAARTDGAASARVKAAASAVREGITCMSISPVGDERAGRVSTRSHGRATQLTAQICAGIVTNRATEYLHPEAEARNMSAGVTKTI